ncbi:hypothetical protein [Planctomyces sp. SH-PL62]|uniref:hypothetical protein n=1 Tax=Planctomyces sp. SH-PL62 TaxID=1636152 RepID=UPI00078C8818|nr:hypothetical protein [Planctomyces sp. SH-PL62]AMV37652.1 hypothetical protein VT85_09460 [Planctomyces sp. SH-PL62]
MNDARQIDGSRFARFDPPAMRRGGPTVGWRINGHPARLLIWSPEEWEGLDVRPIDAQYHPVGVWCALRLEE